VEVDCIICRDGGPRDVIAELPTIWVTAPSRAPLPGYVCVVSKRHVVEPFELDEPERLAFWTESMSVAAALSEAERPSKMNYEIHGNTIRHLHLHLYPRFAGDPFQARPIDGQSAAVVRSPDDIARLRAVFRNIA
jgi:diadenosine tetraphosphate (Ap4A) HIT family hydrolase